MFLITTLTNTVKYSKLDHMTSKWERPEQFANYHGNSKPRIQVPDPTYMTIREVADLLRVSQLTVKRWSNKGDLACVRINSRGDRRYLRSEINKLLGGNV